MPNNLVKNWFGNQFSNLDPLLQQLHTDGGRLTGDVVVKYGSGLAGVFGHRLARKMKFPSPGVHTLTVDIYLDDKGLNWGRCFDDQVFVYSLFYPVGNITEGYWIEKTGPLVVTLTVDIKNGGWYWRCQKLHILGLPIPRWLVPNSTAYKLVENGKYRFYVEFTLPMIGSILSYQGLLQADLTSACHTQSIDPLE